jgi:hypothetical protein
MKNQNSHFRILNLVFWITLGILALFNFPFLDKSVFNHERFAEWYERFDTTKVEIDSFFIDKDENNVSDDKEKQKEENKPSTSFKWNWKDYNGRNCSVSFTIENEEFEKAKRFRESYSSNFSEANLYDDFVKRCDKPISILSNALKSEMDKRNLSGIDRLNFVVTAIQTPPYTFIEVQNCRQGGKCKPEGCCPFILPFAVYTPTEYIFQETGDCDTKSLICYAILKKLNYNVAIIVGDTEGGKHAMLGVAGFPAEIPSYYVRHNGTIYQPWETTNFAYEFQLGNMRMWRSWRNWNVILK